MADGKITPKDYALSNKTQESIRNMLKLGWRRSTIFASIFSKKKFLLGAFRIQIENKQNIITICTLHYSLSLCYSWLYMYYSHYPHRWAFTRLKKNLLLRLPSIYYRLLYCLCIYMYSQSNLFLTFALFKENNKTYRAHFLYIVMRAFGVY